MLFRNRFVLLLALAALLAFVSLSLQFCECGYGCWEGKGASLWSRSPHGEETHRAQSLCSFFSFTLFFIEV